ncbi:MAG: S41 family peptidase, partial [Myxococcota bacterium]
VEELITRLAGLAGVDGARSEVQRDEAERRFAEFIRLELGPKSIWTLTVSDPETNVERVEPLQGTSVDAVGTLERARRSAPYWGERQALPSWSEEHSMLRLATFGTPERGAYLDAIENLATEFKSVDHLAIDLRGNEGGDRSLGIAVARHLLGQPFRQWTSVRTRVREIDDPFDEWVSFPFGSATALTEFPGDEVEDGWVVQGDPLSQMMVPHDGEFPGRITLLVDDATNSAAVEFAVSLLAHHPRVTVVGRETQGECAWHVGQLPVLFQDDQGPAMIASLFEIELVAYAGCRERRGIEPNIPVAYDESDFAEGIDPYLRAIQ